MKIKFLSWNSFGDPKFFVGLLGVCASKILSPFKRLRVARTSRHDVLARATASNAFNRIPLFCALALIIGLGVAFNPDISVPAAYAEGGSDSGISPMSLDPDDETIGISFDSNPTADDISLSTNANPDQVAYITTNFTVTSKQTKEYFVTLNSMNGSIGKLVGKDNPYATIDGVGTNVLPTSAEFGSNKWGYAIGAKNDITYDEKTVGYSSVPAYGEYVDVTRQTIERPTEDEVKDQYKLSFAAKIGSDSPTDHYQTKLYLSVVRTAGRTYTVTFHDNKPAGVTDNVTSMPGEQIFIETEGSSKFNIANMTPALAHYKFLGWSTTATGSVAYQPNGEFTVDSSTPNYIDLYAVWQQKTYTLNFNPNRPASATGTPSGIPNVMTNNNGSFTLPNTSPSLTNYDFKGWSESSTGSVQYQPGATVTIADSGDNPSKTLYAIWQAHDLTGIDNMQQMTPDICSMTSTGTSKQLTDTRDGKKYWVTKLLDGKCWMTQNLDFDIPSTLNSDTSNVSGTVTTNTTKVTSITSWPSSGNTYNAYYDAGNYYYNGPSNNHSQGTRCDTTTNLGACNQFATTGDAHYHVGNYYSWPAATVKSGDSMSTNNQNATQSICPKGWKLPTSNSTANIGSFGYLLTQYGVQSNLTSGSYAVYKDPLSFVYSGYLYSGTLYNTGYYGYYWSSTVYNADRAYYLYFLSSVNPSSYSSRYLGNSVRCVSI